MVGAGARLRASGTLRVYRAVRSNQRFDNALLLHIFNGLRRFIKLICLGDKTRPVDSALKAL
jgi:hypothetical protein